MKIKISVSIGEFIDKMSILQIKEDNGLDVEKELIKYLTYDIVNQDGFEYYLQGAILKYLWRYRYKGKPEQDLQKAHWYLELLQETVRSNNVNSNGKG